MCVLVEAEGFIGMDMLGNLEVECYNVRDLRSTIQPHGNAFLLLVPVLAGADEVVVHEEVAKQLKDYVLVRCGDRLLGKLYEGFLHALVRVLGRDVRV